MTKNLEDRVAIIERWLFDGGKPATNGDLIDLIASWRERGDMLKAARAKAVDECEAIARNCANWFDMKGSLGAGAALGAEWVANAIVDLMKGG